MPRWCLFGTTRDLCEKLESSGKADAIHVSEDRGTMKNFVEIFIKKVWWKHVTKGHLIWNRENFTLVSDQLWRKVLSSMLISFRIKFRKSFNLGRLSWLTSFFCLRPFKTCIITGKWQILVKNLLSVFKLHLDHDEARANHDCWFGSIKNDGEQPI